MSAFWKDEDVEKLKELWERGLSGSLIGNELGKTRNAVIGKANRLGLTSRALPCGHGGTPKGVRSGPLSIKIDKPNIAMVVRRNPKVTPPKFFTERDLLSRKPPISIMELTSTTCHAPVGRGPDGLVTYCGDMTFSGKPFCEGHCAIFYNYEARRRA